MAKKITGLVKLQIPAGKAMPSLVGSEMCIRDSNGLL